MPLERVRVLPSSVSGYAAPTRAARATRLRRGLLLVLALRADRRGILLRGIAEHRFQRADRKRRAFLATGDNGDWTQSHGNSP